MPDRIPVIDEAACIACGACEEICPGVFLVNDSLGFALVINPQGDEEAKIQEAVDSCPTHCISWSE